MEINFFFTVNNFFTHFFLEIPGLGIRYLPDLNKEVWPPIYDFCEPYILVYHHVKSYWWFHKYFSIFFSKCSLRWKKNGKKQDFSGNQFFSRILYIVLDNTYLIKTNDFLVLLKYLGQDYKNIFLQSVLNFSQFTLMLS